MNDLETIKKRFPGISCAYRDIAGTVTTRCFGFADKEANVPVDENTAFPACSISKFITAICVMKEYEQGHIDIDKPINLYLRKWKFLTPSGNESAAPLRSFLSHTSGIIDGEDGFYGLRRCDPPVSLLDVLDGKTSYNNRPSLENNPYGNQFEITRHFFAIWHFVLQRAGTSIKEQSSIHIQNIESLKNMIGYIKNNYRDHISLDLIAKVGCMSKSSCNNLFKKYTGHTPIDYLIRYRLDKAMELMSTSDESIGNISSKCGFASSGYMTEQFVRCYGFTPREFRNSIG